MHFTWPLTNVFVPCGISAFFAVACWSVLVAWWHATIKHVSELSNSCSLLRISGGLDVVWVDSTFSIVLWRHRNHLTTHCLVYVASNEEKRGRGKPQEVTAEHFLEAAVSSRNVDYSASTLLVLLVHHNRHHHHHHHYRHHHQQQHHILFFPRS